MMSPSRIRKLCVHAHTTKVLGGLKEETLEEGLDSKERVKDTATMQVSRPPRAPTCIEVVSLSVTL
jgi:hypothetical protein